MKVLIKTIIVLSLTVTSFQAYGSGATQNMGINMIQNGVATGVSVEYTVRNASSCGRTNFAACVRAALGAMQTLALLQQLVDTAGKQREFGMGDLPDINNLNGLCLNATSAGCTPDSLDLQLTDTPIGEALKTGDLDEFMNAVSQVENDVGSILSDLENKGYKVDQEAGTLTDPSGNTQSLQNLAKDSSSSAIPSAVMDALSSKLTAIGSASNIKNKIDKSSGNAVSNVGGIRAVDEFYDAKARGPASLKKKKKSKDDFLAAISDKAGEGAVGVAGDDIFKMIQRRYNKKKKSKEFIFR